MVSGYMMWRLDENKKNLALYLKEFPTQDWQIYTATTFAGLSVPDYRIPGGSKGWATYQKLRKEGWALMGSDDCEDLPLAS